MMFLGGYWAQQEFNWGGWWSWDTVELTSIFFLIYLIIFIHNTNLICTIFNSYYYKFFFLIILLGVYGLNRLNFFTSIHSFTSAHTYLYWYWLIYLYFYWFFKNYSSFYVKKTLNFSFFYWILVLSLMFFFYKEYNLMELRWLRLYIFFWFIYIMVGFSLNFSLSRKLFLNHYFLFLWLSYFILAFNIFYKIIPLNIVKISQVSFSFNFYKNILFFTNDSSFFLKCNEFLFFKPFNFLFLFLRIVFIIPEIGFLNDNNVCWYWI